MHTPWFVQHIDEEYQEGVNISHKYRTKWLSKLRHTKVKYIFASGLNQVSKLSAFAHETKDKTTNGNNNNNVDDTTNDIITDGMKPSDIIAQAKESGEIESDEESDEENTNGEEEFLNDDPEYFGPDIISTPYISNKVEGNSLPGIRIVVVKEDDISQKFYPITNLPETSPIPLSI